MKTKDIVKEVLENVPPTRDNDQRLIYKVLEAINPQYVSMSVSAILQKINEKQIPSFDTITRWARNIKESTPELRGEKWVERKTKKVEYVQKSLGYE